MKKFVTAAAAIAALAGCAQPYYSRTQTISLAEQHKIMEQVEAARQSEKAADSATQEAVKVVNAEATKAPSSSNNSILLEACNSIVEQSKRLECLKAIPQGEHKAIADNRAEVARAFNDLQSILDAGTSFNSYSSQLETTVKALGNFKSKAKSEEDQKTSKLLGEAIEAYKDAQLFWQRDISWYARSSNKTSYAGGLPIEYTGTAYLVQKYNLYTQKSDIWGLSTGLPRAETLKSIWQAAGTKVKAAIGSSH